MSVFTPELVVRAQRRRGRVDRELRKPSAGSGWPDAWCRRPCAASSDGMPAPCDSARAGHRSPRGGALPDERITQADQRIEVLRVRRDDRLVLTRPARRRPSKRAAARSRFARRRRWGWRRPAPGTAPAPPGATRCGRAVPLVPAHRRRVGERGVWSLGRWSGGEGQGQDQPRQHQFCYLNISSVTPKTRALAPAAPAD